MPWQRIEYGRKLACPGQEPPARLDDLSYGGRNVVRYVDGLAFLKQSDAQLLVPRFWCIQERLATHVPCHLQLGDVDDGRQHRNKEQAPARHVTTLRLHFRGSTPQLYVA